MKYHTVCNGHRNEEHANGKVIRLPTSLTLAFFSGRGHWSRSHHVARAKRWYVGGVKSPECSGATRDCHTLGFDSISFARSSSIHKYRPNKIRGVETSTSATKRTRLPNAIKHNFFGIGSRHEGRRRLRHGRRRLRPSEQCRRTHSHAPNRWAAGGAANVATGSGAWNNRLYIQYIQWNLSIQIVGVAIILCFISRVDIIKPGLRRGKQFPHENTCIDTGSRSRANDQIIR